uniref:Uncharacterized protein n=1 Tax=Branchiostoma floridae TaxID=7739 RepID=C3Z082_BRAFL|eukprot:XP_002598129.1 hypothetical protein BRAFLDRAFT_85653 [Branchiostoma floridae]
MWLAFLKFENATEAKARSWTPPSPMQTREEEREKKISRRLQSYRERPYKILGAKGHHVLPLTCVDGCTIPVFTSEHTCADCQSWCSEILQVSDKKQRWRPFSESEYRFMEDFKVTDDVKADFEKNGYVIIRSLLSSEEIKKLTAALESDEGLKTKSYGRDDTQGRKTKTVMWSNVGNDITGAVARTEKVAGTFEQIIPGSHKAGRVDHGLTGNQAGADLERVSQLEKALGLFHVEINPGDALFFHCNILHRSDQNSSDRRRWSFFVAYNRADVYNPIYKHHHSQYTLLSKLPNSAILECSTATDLTGKGFFSLDKDQSLASLNKKA